MSNYLLHVYREENDKWQQTLNVQRMELPAMREVLSDLIKNKPGEKVIENARNLNIKLEVQTGVIDQISEKIQLQQDKLGTLQNETPEQTKSLTAFYDQEELRDELLRFQKNYLDLKQLFHSYLLSVL
ncbi:MAG: hypothetical protein ACK50E_06225 [Bacteroidota bacterium]